MSNSISAAQHAVQEFFRALSDEDLTIVEPFLAEEVSASIVNAKVGGIHPERVFSGKNEVLSYLQLIIDTFDHVVLVNQEVFVSAEDSTVFLEGRGDLFMRKTGVPYNNTYVFRFKLSAGKIIDIREYANPVVYAKALGLPLG